MTRVYLSATYGQTTAAGRLAALLTALGYAVAMSTPAAGATADDMLAAVSVDLDAVERADVVATMPGAEHRWEPIAAGALGVPAVPVAALLGGAR